MSDGYVSLYRKYRPQTFDDVVEQNHIVSTLKNQIKSNQIAHAYLFTGTRGTGKTSCAKIFAKAVNCLNPQDGSPCFECEACKMLDGANMNVMEIDAASNNSVEDVREMRENIKFSPVGCKYKVYIIDEVHMLSPSAFNALLKSIEEPPSHIIFILATTEVHKIPATILSRVVRLDFRLVSAQGMMAHLKGIFAKEGITHEESALEEIVRMGEGSVRDTLSLAECVIGYAGKNINYEDVLTCMGTSSKNVLHNIADSILSHNIGRFFELVDDEYKKGKNFALLSKELVAFFRDMMVCLTCSSAKEILRLNEIDFNNINELAKKYDKDDIFLALSEFTNAESEFRYASNAKMLFESVGILCMTDEEVKKNEENDDEQVSGDFSAQEIWGRLMSCVYDKQYYALHALCGDLKEFEREGNVLKVSTYKPGLAETYKKLGYNELMQECARDLGLDIVVELVQKMVVKTKEEIIREKLISIFGNKIIFD